MMHFLMKQLPELQNATGAQLLPTPELAGRPSSDLEKYHGMVQQLFTVLHPAIMPTVTLAVRVVEDNREGRPVLTLVFYDNVVNGKAVKGELIYRHTHFADPTSENAWSKLVEQVNHWITQTAQQMVKPVMMVG
jgi:hypothetical protein